MQRQVGVQAGEAVAQHPDGQEVDPARTESAHLLDGDDIVIDEVHKGGAGQSDRQSSPEHEDRSNRRPCLNHGSSVLPGGWSRIR